MAKSPQTAGRGTPGNLLSCQKGETEKGLCAAPSITEHWKCPESGWVCESHATKPAASQERGEGLGKRHSLAESAGAYAAAQETRTSQWAEWAFPGLFGSYLTCYTSPSSHEKWPSHRLSCGRRDHTTHARSANITYSRGSITTRPLFPREAKTLLRSVTSSSQAKGAWAQDSLPLPNHRPAPSHTSAPDYTLRQALLGQAFIPPGAEHRVTRADPGLQAA